MCSMHLSTAITHIRNSLNMVVHLRNDILFCLAVPTPARAAPSPHTSSLCQTGFFKRRSTEQLKCAWHPFRAIQGNESRRKVTESHTSYPTGSFKGRTKGLPPSFPINLYALPHTGSRATSAAHVTYLIWLWGLLLRGDGDSKWEGGFYLVVVFDRYKGGCWYLSWVSLILNGCKADKLTTEKMSVVELTT